MSIRPVIVANFGPPALACIRSWGRAGMMPGMVCLCSTGYSGPASVYLKDYIVLSRDAVFREDGLYEINRFLKSFNASGVMCIDEGVAQWLNNQFDWLPDGVHSWIPPDAMLSNVLNKVVQLETALHVGMNVLPTYLLNCKEDVSEIPQTAYPLCVRPSRPASVSPVFKVKIIGSATAMMRFVDSHRVNSPLIAQPFKNLPNLVVHGTRTINGEHKGLVAFIVERKFEGVTLTLQHIPLNVKLEEECKQFLEQMKLTGHYHFEFLYDTKNKLPYFLEINHRFGGTTAKALACGYPEPLYALQGQGVSVKSTVGLNRTVASNRKALVKNLLFALSNQLSALDYPVEGKLKRAIQILKCLVRCRDEVFSWDDLSGTIAFYLGPTWVRGKQIISVFDNSSVESSSDAGIRGNTD